MQVRCGPRGGPIESISASMFGEQGVVFFRRNAEKTGWERAEIASAALQDADSWVSLAGISGSDADLAALEDEAKKT